MKNKNRADRIKQLKTGAGPGILFGVVLLMIIHADGLAGLKPFANLEAILVVAVGTYSLLWASFPFSDIVPPRTSRIARYGAELSVSMGLLGTLLGMILFLSSIEDVDQIPRRMALALTALFFGIMFSEAFFIPAAVRLEESEGSVGSGPSWPLGGRRLLLGICGFFISVCAIFLILYSLSAVL